MRTDNLSLRGDILSMRTHTLPTIIDILALRTDILPMRTYILSEN